MKAKDKHRDKLLKYLSNPDNEWLGREKLAISVIGFKLPAALWNVFSAKELDEIEREALDNRRRRYARMLALVDMAQLKEAQAGNPQAAKLVYQRFEGWSEKQAHEVSGPGGKPIAVSLVDRILEARKRGESVDA